MMRTLFGCCFFCLLTLTVTPSRGRLPGLGQSLLAAPPVSTQQPEIVASQVAGQQPAPSQSQAPDFDFKQGPNPIWIWGKKPAGAEDTFIFTRSFQVTAKAARLLASCDNRMLVKINGKRVIEHGSWETPVQLDVQKFLQPGENRLTVVASNNGGPAGLLLKLVLQREDHTLQYVVSDRHWTAAKSPTAAPAAAVELGALGSSPWGNVLARAQLASSNRGIFQVLPGFQVERLYTVPKQTQGSWVAMTFDQRGRLLASDQGDRGLYRITVPPLGSQEPTRVEKLALPISSAQGLLYAFDSLYLSVNGGPGSGLYRARDTNGDDQYDEILKLAAFAGGGEHGPHALRLGPDGESIYVIAGNHTNPPENLSGSLLPRNWGEDLLLPRQWDARGHARGRLAPGGWIARTDRDGKNWELVSAGYRNAYDMDFNSEGELFAYDADMEWDLGTPWYRPTRLVHVTSGSEFGWRSGTGKWPPWYADSLPALVDVGPGSPVGVAFGTGARFPARYQRAVYLLDWTFGTMYAVHLTPHGASYRGLKEEFVSRAPLPLTDAEVGPDGALYFTIGGRGAQSELFRVTYVGTKPTDPALRQPDRHTAARRLRRSLEAYHGRVDPAAVAAALPHLGHADRHIRYAARVALEAQPVGLWQTQVLELSDPRGRIHGALGLARQASAEQRGAVLDALLQIEFAPLPKVDKLALLRAYALTCIRLGRPVITRVQQIRDQLEGAFPSADGSLNRELCRVLVYLDSPTVIAKTLQLMNQEHPDVPVDLVQLLARNRGYGGTIQRMLENHPDLQNIHYALMLRNMRFGWTLDQRRGYLSWFNQALQKSGGASYQGFIQNIRKEALATVSAAEKEALASTVLAPPPKPAELPQPRGPGKKWQLAELVDLAQGRLTARNFENGKKMYAAAQCGSCHRFHGRGGATGPDLTNVAGRFSLRDLSEALVVPSQVVSDQYRASLIVTTGGKVVTGRIVNNQDGDLTVITDPFDANKVVRMARAEIDEVRPSPTSLMPVGLLDKLNQDEVLDLIAYLLSRGNPSDLLFR